MNTRPRYRDMQVLSSNGNGEPIYLHETELQTIHVNGTFVATLTLEAATTTGTPTAADWTPVVGGVFTTPTIASIVLTVTALRIVTSGYVSGNPTVRIGTRERI